jgi:DNA-damage-inducible protein D
MAKRKKDQSEQTEKSVVIFEDHPVRRVWNEKDEKWYFAVPDIIQVLAESVNPTDYIKKMRSRDEALSKGWGQIVTPLSIETKGGRQKVNCANVEGTLRIIQSIPSKKAEPFKLWLAKVGYERLQETVDPEQAIIRARNNWKQLGRSDKWITYRMRGQEGRHGLTDYWHEHGVKEGMEYAKLTDVIHQEWAGLTTAQHKRLKGLKKQNLRDNMTEAELIFTALAELSTTQIAKAENAEGYGENERSAKKGGSIAKNARKQLEEQTGKSMVSSENFLPPAKQSKRKLLE